MRRKYEPPQPKNPHRLTVNQHVHSAAAIRRFTDERDMVAILRLRQKRIAPFCRRPENEIFCAKRVWSQHLESNFRSFEDAFQAECEDILRTHTVHNHQAITDYLALWQARSWLVDHPPADIELPRFLPPPETRTKDEQEQLEASRISFVRGDGTLPARFLAFFMGMRAFGENRRRMRASRWGVIRVVGTTGFLCPDRPPSRMIPLDRATILVANWHDQNVDGSFVDVLNRFIMHHAQEFIFGHPHDVAAFFAALRRSHRP